MLPSTQRHLLVIVLLLVGVGLTWGQRWSQASRASAGVPTPAAVEEENPAGPPAEHVYFLDIEGWYRITPYETVVRSPYDLTAETSEAMAQALPANVGQWQQVGEDEFIADDPAVVYYLKNPTVALQRTYHNPAGQAVTLAIIGNKGEDSFLLFSHTPETCYPGRLWQVTEKRRESTLIGDEPMHARYLLTEHAETGQKLMVLFWYLWDNPQRNSEEGVLSVRVNVFLPPEGSEAEALAAAWDFVRALFPTAILWERF